MYDFIVVGSGPAGACLASRLAKTRQTPQVLLIEAGPAKDDRNPILLAERLTAFVQYPSLNWGYKTIPQTCADNRQVDYSRGKGLGGGSQINFCCWTVGPKDDYDRWAAEVGDQDFSWESNVRARRQIESYDDDLTDEYRAYTSPDMSVHGKDGPVRIEFGKEWIAPMKTFLDAAKQSSLGVTKDFNDGCPLGFTAMPSTGRAGARTTADGAYLSGVPSNLTIQVEAQVTKILFEAKKAVGVVANGKEYRASKDVLLSCGAVDTPKLLQLSGIGARDELAKHKIPCLHHLPGVGANLEDHCFLHADWQGRAGIVDWKDPTSIANNMTFGFFKAPSALASPAFDTLPADVQEHCKKSTVPQWELGAIALPSPDDPSAVVLGLYIFNHCVQSRGTVRLASADPKADPLIDPELLSHPFDRVVAVAAARGMLEFAKTPALREACVKPINVPKSDSEEDILAFWRANLTSTWHPSCTVRMGAEGDEMACLQSDFRVRGCEGLRVVDMSATPFLLNCHVQSVAYFIGHIAADKMVAEYGLDN